MTYAFKKNKLNYRFYLKKFLKFYKTIINKEDPYYLRIIHVLRNIPLKNTE